MSVYKSYMDYVRQVKENGLDLESPEDCGCMSCQVTYAWIKDGAPGMGGHYTERQAEQLLTGQEP